MRLNALLAGIALGLCALSPPAHAKPPLEAFGDMPAVRSPDISPDGKYVAYISRIDGVDYLANYDVTTGKNEALIRMPDVKAKFELSGGGSHFPNATPGSVAITPVPEPETAAAVPPSVLRL